MALPPDADAGDKFIFHSKILLCDLIVPQRRISVNYAILGFGFRQLCEGRVCSDEGFVCKASAEAEAGDEAVEAVSVEKISADREVLLEVRPLFFGDRLGQF